MKKEDIKKIQDAYESVENASAADKPELENALYGLLKTYTKDIIDIAASYQDMQSQIWKYQTEEIQNQWSYAIDILSSFVPENNGNLIDLATQVTTKLHNAWMENYSLKNKLDD